ncbi:hypothetical protein KUH32_13360 [Thalassococcus sp. CAU 1522]|uniref:Uncharacterized protein n=1 Tax=Thalassococcus arenae TaxID=2851652 RepID=A0ABS6N9W0_9RHOB|nr:hypothetical protein [Thalassococcus arenae]MBV2360768.1 hypothetical protein [Thalassococcus arenae]
MRSVLAVLTACALPGLAAAQVCVRNDSGAEHLFAAEIKGGARIVRWLASGEELCARGGGDGVVSVFESADALEGCSRLVPSGRTEALLHYADFDRCAWSSNQ